MELWGRANGGVNHSQRGRSPGYNPGNVCPGASRSVGCSPRSRRNPSEALPKLVAKDCSGQERQLLDVLLNYYFCVKCMCANMVHVLILNNATGNLCHLPPEFFLKISYKPVYQPQGWEQASIVHTPLSAPSAFFSSKVGGNEVGPVWTWLLNEFFSA